MTKLYEFSKLYECIKSYSWDIFGKRWWECLLQSGDACSVPHVCACKISEVVNCLLCSDVRSLDVSLEKSYFCATQPLMWFLGILVQDKSYPENVFYNHVNTRRIEIP